MSREHEPPMSHDRRPRRDLPPPTTVTGHDHIHELPRQPLFRYVFSSDHKIIAIQFLFSG